MVKFLGHASIYLNTGNTSLVVDPWFTKKGAFLNTWFQFPDNTDIDFSWKDDLDYVCISHEHEDHFDLEFLKTLNDETQIVIPNYKNKRFFNLIKDNLPNHIIEVEHQQKCVLGDIEFYPIIQMPGWDDCGLLFKTKDEVILDLNDMKISNKKDIKWIKDNFDIDYLFVQFSGANWFPHIYPQYTDEQVTEICRDSRRNKFKNVVNLFKTLEAKLLLPCAGPPCFLDDEQFNLNFLKENGFPNQKIFYEYFNEDVCILLPDDEIKIGMDIESINKRNLNHKCFSDKIEYLTDYKNRRTEIIKDEIEKIETPNESLFNKMKEQFAPVMKSNRYFRDKISGKILFKTEYENIVIDFTNRREPVRCGYESDCMYEYNIESKFLKLVLDGDLDWETFFLSMRFKAERNPDKYNEFLMIFLKYPYENSLKTYELYDKNKKLNERFILKHKNKSYKCQKYCPHLFGDLSKGEVVDGSIVCPLHGWKFSLDNGKCLTNNSNINLEEIT